MIESFESAAQQCGMRSERTESLVDMVSGPSTRSAQQGISDCSSDPDLLQVIPPGDSRWSGSGDWVEPNCNAQMVVRNQQESCMECFRVYVCGIHAATCARDLARQSVNAPPLPVSKPVEARQRGAAGIEPSVGSKGDSYDNAMAETINGLCKAGLVHRRVPWKTVESLEPATLEWVTWFNHQRLLEFIGSIPPAEAEQRYYLQLAK